MPPLSLLLVIILLNSVGREASYFFSALSGFDIDILCPPVFVCTQVWKGKGKNFRIKPCYLLVLDRELIKSPLPLGTCLPLLYMRQKFTEKGIMKSIKISRLHVTPGKILHILHFDPVPTPVKSKCPILCYHLITEYLQNMYNEKSCSNFRFI